MFITLSFQNNFLKQVFKKKGVAMLLLFFCNYVSGQYCAWAKAVDGDGYNEGSGVCADANGNVFMTGFFKANPLSFGTQTLSNYGVSNVYLAKYSANGSVVWSRGGI